jgi:hypothetical protein
MLTTSNMIAQNYKHVDLTKGYNFDIKCIFIWPYTKMILFF